MPSGSRVNLKKHYLRHSGSTPLRTPKHAHSLHLWDSTWHVHTYDSSTAASSLAVAEAAQVKVQASTMCTQPSAAKKPADHTEHSVDPGRHNATPFLNRATVSIAQSLRRGLTDCLLKRHLEEDNSERPCRRPSCSN